MNLFERVLSFYLTIAVSEIFAWGDVVSDVLFEFFHFGEAALFFSVPDSRVIYGDCVDTTGIR